jgi:hypothetical protein
MREISRAAKSWYAKGAHWCLDIFAAEPIKPEVEAWIAAQRLNRLAQVL